MTVQISVLRDVHTSIWANFAVIHSAVYCEIECCLSTKGCVLITARGRFSIFACRRLGCFQKCLVLYIYNGVERSNVIKQTGIIS